jgi:hypothetical protein
MLVGEEGVEVIVIGVQAAALVPQEPPAVTQTFPDVEPIVVLIEVVFCPLLIDVPAGTVHV